jgi:hypothetical protein
MPIVLNGTTGITTPTYNGSTTAEYLVPVTGFKNRIINGDMTIDQRNAGAAVTAGSSYTLDRWNVDRVWTGSTVTIQQSSTAPTGFVNSLSATVSTGAASASNSYFSIQQYIEGNNIADLGLGTAGAQNFTVSFWVRSSVTGTFGVCFRNSAFNLSYCTTYTINAANTWEQKSVTIAAPTSGTFGTGNSYGLNVIFSLGGGSSVKPSSNNAWVSGSFLSPIGQTDLIATTGATFFITGVQLEKGSNATSFDYLPYGTELALCQRYYEKSYPQSVTVPSNNQVGYAVMGLGSTTYVGSGSGGAFAQNLNTIFFKVTKRTTPTITTYSYANSTVSVASNAWSGADLAANTATLSSPDNNGFNIYNNSGSSQTVNSYAVMVHYTASAEL